MEEVHDKVCQDSARRTGSDQPIPPSRVEDMPWDPLGMPPQVTGEAHPHDRTSSSRIVTGH